MTDELPCPVCGKPDWCVIARDGKSAYCQREDNHKRRSEAGWFYKFRRRISVRAMLDEPVRSALEPEVVAELAKLGQKEVTHAAVNSLARSLCLPLWTLGALGIGYDIHKGWWFFPMFDGDRRPVGLRYRLLDGRKYSLKGGREGVFLSNLKVESDLILLPEGPTDTAAALSLGFRAIGRPSCLTGGAFVERLTEGESPQNVVVIADSDTPGIEGALRLRDRIGGVVISPRDYKDIRELVAKCPTPLKVVREDLLIAKRTEGNYGPWHVIN